MLGFGISRLVSLLECSCKSPLTPIMMVIRGLVFHPSFCMVLMRGGSYLVCLCVRAWLGYMLWQYVNSMSWIVSVGEGDIGVCVWFGALIMHKIYGCSLARHWHVVCGHVHVRSLYGIVYLGVLLLRLLALVSVNNRVFIL